MKVSLTVALTAAVWLTTPPSIHSFRLAGWNHLPSSSALYAKSANQKKKKASPPATRGGFGKALASPDKAAKQDDDYAAFPALEPKVQETVLPVKGEVHYEGEALPTEIKDRLDQIYGFRHFNYPQQQQEVEVSFGDILAANDDAKSAAVDYADLLASTTGGEVSTNCKSASTRAADLPLSSLPPFSELRVLHVDPLVIAIDNFFTDEECDRYVSMSEAPASKNSNAALMTRSKTVGKDALAKAQRTSTTWFHHFKEVPELMAKASRLLGLDGITNWEEPQTVRYRRSERFTWHLDALAPLENLESLGGQRTATLLVYLTELSASDGGATVFRDLTDSNGTLRV
jgi:hypothetical protein